MIGMNASPMGMMGAMGGGPPGAAPGGMPPMGGMTMGPPDGMMPPMGGPPAGGGPPNLLQMLDGPAGLQVLQVLLQTLQQNQTPPPPPAGGQSNPLIQALLAGSGMSGGLGGGY